MDEVIVELCGKGKDGEVLKSNITVKNYEMLANYAKSLDIKILQEGKLLSYREYCKLFEANLLKKKECGGKICCQAITEDGTRCKRPASEYTSIDLTEKNILPSIPDFLKEKLGYSKVVKLRLLGFATSCCFYCRQHAAMFLADKLTYASNLSYYTTHIEDVLNVFFDNVKPKKIGGVATYNFYTLGDLRSLDEIITRVLVLRNQSVGVGQGLFDWIWWGFYFIVFFYNSLKPHIVERIEGNAVLKELVSEDVAVLAAAALLELKDMETSPPRVKPLKSKSPEVQSRKRKYSREASSESESPPKRKYPRTISPKSKTPRTVPPKYETPKSESLELQSQKRKYSRTASSKTTSSESESPEEQSPRRKYPRTTSSKYGMATWG